MEISPDIARQFISLNSLNPASQSKVADAAYGIFRGCEMVFACTLRHIKANKYEIIDYAQKCGIHVCRALDACLSQIIADLQPSYVKCCLDRRFFNVRTLDDCRNFTSHYLTKSNFYYAQYSSAHKIRPDEVTEEMLRSLKKYDPLKSAEQNLRVNYFAKVYDAGQIVMTWKRH